ncbi:AbiH family protein [Dysgonomonas sp. ZJ709]|uniref:AbiH family protein n=1 Tax=Dysgonomonas sp. ZJ709 TaxID=2709797 RepID=UPI0013EC8EC3|nr:AbiH family protein [Dysgonomonas sp. ZJ709]
MNKSKEYDTILILGNGFDLNLGLKTGYTDFIQSVFFTDLIKENHLCQYLQSQHELKNWIDIENELKIYSSKNESPNTFKSDFTLLSKSLINYLSTIDYSNIPEKSIPFDILKSIGLDNLLIIDFNYTNTIKVIMERLQKPSNILMNNHIKVHGSIDEGQIIFGVEDNARIKSEYVFLKKAYNSNFKTINFDPILKKASRIIIFGHSLGETDHMYFKDFFNDISIGYDTYGTKKIDLFFYTEDGYFQLFKQLDALTNNRLSMLKRMNNLETIDTNNRNNINIS